MTTERWRVLSEWHNSWLAAPADERVHLQAAFASEHPELLSMADELTDSSDAVDGFLETQRQNRSRALPWMHGRICSRWDRFSSS